MRLKPFHVAVIAFAAGSGSASAQGINLEGSLRAWSAVATIGAVCKDFYGIDEGAVAKARDGLKDMARSEFPQEFSEDKANAEAQRREREVEITGAEQWCAYQRSHLSVNGMAFLFTADPSTVRNGGAEVTGEQCQFSGEVVGLNAAAGGLLNVRSGPDRQAAAIDQVRLGDKVEICSTRGDWTSIRYAGGKAGWVSSRYLSATRGYSDASPSTVAHAEPIRSDQFRPGEQIETTEHYTVRYGAVGRHFYRYYSDGSAAISVGPDILSDKLWSVSCKTDAMDDKRRCSISDDDSGLFVFFERPDVYSVCALHHDYPGRTGMIRIEKQEPIETSESGCVDEGSSLVQMIARASDITIRAYKWPRDVPRDRTGNLDGFSDALALAKFLYERRL